jgi:hypothetical protein
VWVAPGARSGVPPTVGPVEFSPSHGVRPTVFLYRNCCYSSEAEHATRNGGVVGCCRREWRCRRTAVAAMEQRVWWQRPELKLWVVGVQQPQEIEEVDGERGWQ